MPSGRRHYRLTLADALAAHEAALKRSGYQFVPLEGMVLAVADGRMPYGQIRDWITPRIERKPHRR